MESQDYNTQNDMPFFSPQVHSFNVGIAVACESIDAGIVFNHVIFWLEQNKINSRNQIDGRTWMYESIQTMQRHMPYLSEMQVKRALAVLVEKGYLLRENYNKNRFDKTNWYALGNEEWLDVKKMFSKGHQRPIGGSPRPDPMVEFAPSYIDKDSKTDIKTDGEEESARTPSSKKKKEQIPMVPFGEYVQLKEGEYEKLVSEMGKGYVDYYIQAINNYVPNGAKTYKDFAAAVRQWYLGDRGKNTLPNLQKIKETELPPSPDRIQANRRMCELIENKLKHRFSSLALFQAGSSKAELVNKHKDFKREYDYEKLEKNQLKEILLKDLEVCFPGSRDMLLGNTNQKITSIISNLSEKYKMSGTS